MITIERLFTHNVTALPLLNSSKQLCSYAFYGEPEFSIANTCINSDFHSVYTIAEIGVNHNGNIDEAFNLINCAHEHGASAVKFQLRTDSTYTKFNSVSDDLSVQYIKDELARTSFGLDQYIKLFEHSKSLGIDLIITPFDHSALDVAIRYADAIKVASCDLTNIPLLQSISNCSLPIIVSTGMSYEHEVIEAFNVLKHHGNVCFLHCNSTYPTPIQDLNLSYIPRLSELTNYIVGFSSHTPDVSILSAAVALGAKVVEFHITSDRDQVGTDHLSSFELSELQLVISTLHHVSQSLGLSTPRYPSQGELNNRISLSKSLCYKSDLNVGHTLIQSDFCLKSPGSGLPYSDLYSFIGRTLLSDVSYSQPVQHSHINDNQVLIKTPSLPKSLELGLPIRYHDAISLHDKFNLPCYEIHYSDKDLSLTPDQFLPSIDLGCFLFCSRN